MIAVIIAGGSGTRLWPLSTPAYPKHLLKVGDHDTSLLQQTYQRISAITDDIYVIPEKSHAQHVREQLPLLPAEKCLVEPARRGTANCTMLALDAIQAKYDSDEPIIILWADHFIRNVEGFAYTIKTAADASIAYGRIVLVGIEPTYPATGFGYIQKRELLNNDEHVYEVESFKEKPDVKTAEQYLVSGQYLWNSGYFIATIGALQNAITTYAPDLWNATGESYSDLPVANIDNVLIEKIPDLLVVPAAFDWMDLGSYDDLHKANLLDSNGNFVKGNVELSGVENSYIENQEDKPVAVIGLDNIAVVNTKDGILVTRKDLSQTVGDIGKQINAKEYL